MKTKEIEYRGKTTLPNTTDDKTFDILQALFPDIQLVDKYMKATMGFFFNEACKEVFRGKDYVRASVNQMNSIREKMLVRLRSRFGRWINFSGFKWDRKGGFKFNTNFSSTYKTAKGILYGHSPNHPLREVFFTAHSLARFDERIPEKLREYMDKKFFIHHRYKPTAADLLGTAVYSSKDYGIDKSIEYRYVNVHVGVLVVETFRGVHIVKTFLTPEMLIDRDLDWFEVSPTSFEDEHYGGEVLINSLTELFDHKARAIIPTFMNLKNFL